MGTNLAVAAPNRLSVQAALDVAADGGNAVDAAVAAIVVAMATEPGVVSPLGGAYVNVWPAGGAPVVFDGTVEMPGRGLPPERFGQGVREVTTSYGGGLHLYTGLGSAATPGALAALGSAHARYGASPWAELLSPAARAAREGFPMGAAAATYLRLTRDSIFGWDEQTLRTISLEDGSAPEPGDILRCSDLADALDLIGREGAKCAYTGAIAATLAADMAERGGLVTAEDLAAYEVVEREPLHVRLGSWSLATNPPPSIGGPVLTTLLRLVRVRQPVDVAAVIDTQRLVLDYRRRHLDTADDLGHAGRELVEAVAARGAVALSAAASTAHVSVVDGSGMACAVTASAGYGSGATVPGTGLMLNNCLGEPELNRLGLHALAPGTRLASNMAPTTGVADGGGRLAIGTPGADRITTALMQVLLAYCLDGKGLQEAIDQPRIHVRHLDDGTVRLDHERDPQLAAAAAAAGMPTFEHAPGVSMFFGGVGAAVREADGTLRAAADPRREAAIGVAGSTAEPSTS